jgi:hypothetical protein
MFRKNKTLLFYIIMDTPSNPSFFNRNTKHVPYNIQQSPLRKREGDTNHLPPPRKPTIGPKWYL